jgi:hypothetical protein
LIGKPGCFAANESVDASISSSAWRATRNFGRSSPPAFSRIEPELSTMIATAAPSPSSPAGTYLPTAGVLIRLDEVGWFAGRSDAALSDR